LPPERAAKLPPEALRRRQLAAMTNMVLAGARSQPAVVVFEDLHWADPTSIDLMRALAERGAQAPLLLLATTRPEFRPPWSLRSHHSLIALSPLDRAGVARMVGEISSRHALSKEVVDGVTERTGGVPLFVEEVTRLLLERGEQGGVPAIPPTLQQSLAARLDRLGAAREVAQVGAVLGRDFAYALLRRVAELDEPGLQASLDRLAEADLLFVEGAPPQASYRFKHALIQDAALDPSETSHPASGSEGSDAKRTFRTGSISRPTSGRRTRNRRLRQALQQRPRLCDLRHLLRWRKTFERGPEDSVGVCATVSRLVELSERQRRAQTPTSRALLLCDLERRLERFLGGGGIGRIAP
jgi:hypothetical protein